MPQGPFVMVNNTPISPWSGNINAAGYSLQNLSSITGASGNLTIATSRLYVKANSESYALGLYYNAASVLPVFLGCTSAGVFQIADAGGSPRLVLTQAGNFGIGTTTPASLLDVAGSARFQAALFRPASGTLTVQFQDGTPTSTTTLTQSSTQVIFANNALPIEFTANTNGGNSHQVYLASNGRTYLAATSEVFALGLYYAAGDTPFFLGAAHTSGDLVFSDSGGVERARLTASGKFGIGRTATAKFAVSGLTTYASNSAALTGGLTAGDFYTDGSGNVKVVF
jgi:hypothetical protein